VSNISREQLLHVARLARLELRDEEIERLGTQLNDILAAVSKVSELDLSLYRTGYFLYQELSKKFEYYSGALDYTRKAYFASAPGEDPFAGFMRQVEGWIKVNITEN